MNSEASSQGVIGRLLCRSLSFIKAGSQAVLVLSVVSRIGIRQHDVGRNPMRKRKHEVAKPLDARTRVARSFDSFVSHALMSYRTDISMLVSGQRHAYLYTLPSGFACSRRSS